MDRAGVSSTSDVAVLMVLVLGHSGGEEQDSGRPWWWRRFGYDISQIVLRRPDSGIVGENAGTASCAPYSLRVVYVDFWCSSINQICFG
jgi:hypothetical protein